VRPAYTALMILALISAASAAASLLANNPYSTQISGPPGLKLTYVVEPVSSYNLPLTPYIPKTIQDLIGRDLLRELSPNFYVVLAFNYSNYVKNPHNITYVISRSCSIISSSMQIEVTQKYCGSVDVAKVTLIFSNGVAICPKQYLALLQADSRWVRKGDLFITKFRTLKVSRVLVVNKRTGEAQLPAGFGCCDWVFKLSKRDVQVGYSFLLYSVNNLIDVSNVEKDLSGIASVVYVNLSSSEPTKLVPFMNRAYYVDEEDVTYILQQKKIVEDLPPFIIKYRYLKENKTLFIYEDLTPKYLGRLVRSWSYIARVSERCYKYSEGTHSFNYCYVLRGLNYRGSKYILLINYGVGSVKYGSDGVLRELLAWNSHVRGNLYSLLPAVIVRSFGITQLSTAASYSINISLVSYVSSSS